MGKLVCALGGLAKQDSYCNSRCGTTNGLAELGMWDWNLAQLWHVHGIGIRFGVGAPNGQTNQMAAKQFVSRFEE